MSASWQISSESEGPRGKDLGMSFVGQFLIIILMSLIKLKLFEFSALPWVNFSY